MIEYIDSFPGREITVNGKPFLYFGGTAYLGLQTHKDFQQLFINNIGIYGTGYGASRKSNVKISIYDQAEESLAHWVGSEACTTLSSGFLAGQLVAQHFDHPQHKRFYAPNSHSALYVTKTKPYTTFTAMDIAIREHLTGPGKSVPVVFMDSIDFSGGNYPDFEGLKALPLEEIILVVDDSHGIGIVGDHGGGVFQNIKRLNPKELLVCCSLGKGFGVQAGAIFGDQKRIDQLTATDFFGGASPAAPAAMASFVQGESIFRRQRALLQQHIGFFLKSIQNPGYFKYFPDHPTFGYTDQHLSEYLYRQGFITTNFPYPSESASVMSRIVLSASHRQADLTKLTMTVNSFFR
jgi:7-keto-8-aminopelargonate synthetase-like enzyme